MRMVKVAAFSSIMVYMQIVSHLLDITIVILRDKESILHSSS